MGNMSFENLHIWRKKNWTTCLTDKGVTIGGTNWLVVDYDGIKREASERSTSFQVSEPCF
jgi:hypothetical protein